LSGRGLCDELITRPEESYRLCCVVVCDLETSRMGGPYIYDISRLRVKNGVNNWIKQLWTRLTWFRSAISGNSCKKVNYILCSTKCGELTDKLCSFEISIKNSLHTDG